MKFLMVCGGTASGIGKGITVSSIGVLLKACGYRVTSIKIDPYLNVDAGTMNPYEHGEVFVLDDGGEVDLDLGNYERFLNITLTRRHNITSGKIYQAIIEAERKGEFLGKTVQVVPHVTDAFQKWIQSVAEVPVADSDPGGSPQKPGVKGTPEVCLIELGGTVGDIESSASFEALRQLRLAVGPENFALCFVSYVPFLRSVGELKTKPTQHGVKELRALGLFPDILVCRAEQILTDDARRKIAMFSNLSPDSVLTLQDVPSTYDVPMVLETQGMSRLLCAKLGLSWREPRLVFWGGFAEKYDRLQSQGDLLRIAIVAKYMGISDAYLSVLKAMEHASVWANRKLKIEWISAEDLESGAESDAMALLSTCDGVFIPGGFGARGFEGKVRAASYARQARKPFLGICFGMQAAVVSYARDVLGLAAANTAELAPDTPDPVVVFMPEIDKATMGGNMRLGSRTCILADGSLTSRIYGGRLAVSERHRHRYEVNSAYVDRLEAQGLIFAGRSEEGDRMEVLELRDHPFFMGCQFHPEMITKPLAPAPLYLAFLLAASGQLEESMKEGGALKITTGLSSATCKSAMWVYFLLLSVTAGFPQEGDVLVLDDSSLDEAVKQNTYLLVEFYAPWCGHCQKLAPEYAKAATALKAHSPPLPLAKVDATVNPMLTERYQITSFPTLKFFFHGKPREYEGGRIEEEISYWVREQIKPVAKKLETSAAVNEFIEKGAFAAVLFAEVDSEAWVQFEIAAKDSGKRHFAVASSLEVAQDFGVPQPTLVLFNHKENTRRVFSQVWSDEKITDFVNEAKLPLVMEFALPAVEFVIEKRNPLFFVFRPEAQAEQYFPVLLKTAKSEEVRFCFGDLSSPEHVRLAHFLGVTAQPTVLLLDARGEVPLKYKYTEQAIDEVSLSAFIRKWREQSLTPYYKSETLGATDPLSAVQKLNSESFTAATKDPAVGALVLLYTDWCVRCHWVDLEAVAQSVASLTYVQVAKVDMMHNELRELNSREWPVLLWYPPVPQKAAIRYEGKLHTAAVIEWLQNQLLPVPKTDL